ncbi:cellulase family glycosylhydrolase [Actinoplanes siamensis]|uniref:Glycoside hydrolase family 5 domain-containing protein n=1 Tax=Actinoplanes siamensis TaxID=1223317 RepID=A0A919N3U3_9ACTN|nr:cellulase family glycosylhydrolase [Actinoplanes siamensis]GIF03887.1 hypothetical protein Asi03nite_14250 [Actinoplanes siamensis]
MSSARFRTLALSFLLTACALAPSVPALAGPGAQAAAPTPTMRSRLEAVRTSRTINYYPSDAGWSAMWTQFDAKQVDKDLAKAAGLGADSVRIVVFPQVFGFPKPKPEYLDRLGDMIHTAARHGLAVKLTLFDWWADYDNVQGSAAWAEAVVGPYADDPRVIAVEVKNEISPADRAAMTWVRRVIPAIRRFAPRMPLTLSVDGHAGPPGLARLKRTLGTVALDYYDFHFYGASEQALADIRKAKAAVAPKPMVIGETGLSTTASSAGEQAAYLARVFRAAAVAGVDSVAPWTLTDFADGAIPSNSVVSTLPAQYQFGLYRTDGTAKPAAAVVRTAWSGREPGNEVLNLGFEQKASDSPWQENLPEAGLAQQTGEVAHSGRRSVRFARTGRADRGLPSLRISPVTPVQAGQRWSASAWARGSRATGLTEISLSWFGAEGQWISETPSRRLPPGTTGWTKLSIDTVAPRGAAGVQLHLKSGDNTGVVWFDDVSLS